jgi:hypothetical protein
MNATARRADALQPGDVILTPGYDSDGMSTEYRFTVTSTLVYSRRTRISYDGGSRTLPNATLLRIELEPAPREGIDRCACGGKYWDGDRCHSCGERFRP